MESPVKQNYRLNEGDEVSFFLPEAVEPDILPENIPLDILYEDEDVLVVNKPKGMVVHPAAGHYSHTLVNALMYHCRDSLSGINGVMRPGIVHRIDRDTTGSLLVCKNDAAHLAIAAQLKEHSIVRRYRAVVYGVIDQEEGVVNLPVGRDPSDRKRMAAGVRKRQGGCDALSGAAALSWIWTYPWIYLHRMPPGDGKNPPDPGTHGSDRPSASRGRGIQA